MSRSNTNARQQYMQNLAYNTRYSRAASVGPQFPSAPVAGDGNCYIRQNGRVVGVQQVSPPNFWESQPIERQQQQLPVEASIPSVESINLSGISSTEHVDEINDEVPEEFLCPITMCIMKDPVICEDGYTYERVAIMGISNSLSPMTRQPINKSNLIPNRALKQYIEKFTSGLNIPLTPEQIQAKKLAELEREKLKKLAEFQQEQIKKKEEERQARLEAIRKEREEKAKREAEARVQEQKGRQEQSELQMIYHMVSGKLPELETGYSYGCPSGSGHNCFYSTVSKCKLSIDTLEKIKRGDINVVKKIYQKIKSDIEWIEKYGVGSEEFNPYVDYVFDHFIDSNQIDDMIDKKEKEIKSRDSTNSWNCNQYFNEKAHNELILNDYKAIKAQFTRSREYYYVNGTGIEQLNWTQIGYNNCPPSKPYQKWQYDQESMIRGFLTDFESTFISNNFIMVDNMWGGGGKTQINPLEGHKALIRYRHQINGFGQNKDQFSSFFTKSDYKKLLELGNIYTELIELVRPEVTL